jgi:hypothetical protein
MGFPISSFFLIRSEIALHQELLARKNQSDEAKKTVGKFRQEVMNDSVGITPLVQEFGFTLW